MVKFEFYPLTVDYMDDLHSGSRGVIRLFGRTQKGDKVCVFDSSFSQYFWAILENKEKASMIIDKILGIKIQDSKRNIYATEVNIQKKKFLAKEVYALKIEVNNPKDVDVLRKSVEKMDGVEKCLETDIPFVRRYLADKKIIPLVLCHVEGDEVETDYKAEITVNAKKIFQDGGDTIEKPKILSFDIEVYNKRRSPKEDLDPIVMVAFYGSDNYKKVITWKKFDNASDDVEFVGSEGELIVRIKDVINEFKPDYMVGYFSDGFDWPYIRARADKHKIKLNVGIDGSNVKFSRGVRNQSAKIVGISHIDVLKFVRRILSGQINLPTYKLDTVAKHLLGKGKTEDNIENLYRSWDSGKGLDRFCEYNLTDAKITYEIFEKILPHLDEFVKLVGLAPNDVSRMSYGRLVESYVLRNLSDFNELAPNRPYHDEIKRREAVDYEGAFVYEPKAGLYNDIAVFDFKSLYPTVISAHNICASTLTDNKKESHESPEIEYDGEKIRYYFTHKYDGIFPKLIRSILERRNRVKEMLNKNKKDSVLDARQYSLKVLANSAYGYLGFSGARWYCKECAASITAYGRDYIHKVIKRAEGEKFNVLYGDTDSVFISLGKGKTMEDAERFLRDVNNGLPSLMELELDGFYPRGIFVMKKGEEGGAKKKYALVDNKGDVKVVGFETVRGDWSVIAKEVQKEVLKIILVKDDIDAAVKYVKDVVKDVKDNKIPVKKMIIKKQLLKEVDEYASIGPHVNVAKKMIEKGEIVGAGSEIRYVVQPGKGSIGDRSLPSDEAKIYDVDYYLTHQIIPVVERIFSAVGYEKEDLLGEHKQKSLGDF
jgi:DNA polymerase, archaea type